MLLLAANIFLLITSSIASPLSGLHNNDVEIEENKFKTFESESSIAPLFVPTSYRLPNNSIPISYDLRLTTDIDKAVFNFTGAVKIHIKIVDESQEIVLHYRQTTIEVINLWSSDGTTLLSSSLLYEQIPVFEFLVITLPNAAQPDEEFVLEINYTCEHRADGAGFYRGSYNQNGQQIWYATTQFEIDDARHAMPSYDEPGIRAPINLTIKHGKAYTAVANTDIEEVQDDGDYFVTKFLPTPSIQTYLLAFLVSDFDYVNATNTRIPQKIYARPEMIANGDGDFAATVVGPILRGLEEHLGVDFPLSKMDHVGLTVFNFGAMENIGLITYTENGLLYNPNTIPASQESRKMSITRLIAHEYVHQWFGDIVSPAWWTYVWLNEGFATLLSSYISSVVYPELNFVSNYITGDMPRAFSVDVLSSNSWAMNHYTEEPARLWDKFGGIGYQKSGMVLRMFQETLTPATFAKGLNYYITKMYMKAAIPDDLHEGLQRAYDEDYPGNDLNINDLMHSWEDRPGYPIISVQKINNDFLFSQRRYPGSAGEIYSVPITIATKSNANFTRKTPTVWLKDAADLFTQSELNFETDDWIILNIQQVGYYRVDYDTSLWRAIIKQLTENHSVINPINRAVLQDEIYLALTDSTLNRVTISDCIDILSYFGGEDEPIAWSKANTLLNTLNNRLFGTSRYNDFLEFLKQITNPHLTSVGYEPIDFEPSARTSLRSSTKSWNCLALNEYCLSTERGKFTQFYNTGNSASFDYCAALRNINDEIYLAIVDGVALNASYTSRSNYLQYLGCSLRRENLINFFSITLDSNILSATERQNIFTNSMTRSVVALDTTIEFIDANYATLNTAINSTALGNILRSMASLVNTNVYIEKLEALITKLTENGIAVNASEIRISYLNNIKWQDDHFHFIDEWFQPPQETTTQTAPPPTTTTTTTTTTTPSTTSSVTPPTTTAEPTDGANSIILSFALLIACLTLNLLRK